MMNLKEAIEILGDIEPAKLSYFLTNEKQALRLGIEALERLQHARQEHVLANINPLPSETKD